ncbi:MAG: L,D-transpeptidase [Ginsengibacter sp.]
MRNRTHLLSSAIIISLFCLSFVPNKRASRHDFRKKEHVHSKADNPYYIVISKKDYELKVYDDEGWYATYPCVFGSNDLRDKFMEGDKRTPEGKFKVLLKKIHPKWGFELLLDYPTEENVHKFQERKAEGLVPRNAKIGGGIAIHATRPQEEWTVDYYQNWTDGCVSLKYTEAKDLYSYIPVGTPVTIEK